MGELELSLYSLGWRLPCGRLMVKNVANRKIEGHSLPNAPERSGRDIVTAS